MIPLEETHEAITIQSIKEGFEQHLEDMERALSIGNLQDTYRHARPILVQMVPMLNLIFLPGARGLAALISLLDVWEATSEKTAAEEETKEVATETESKEVPSS